MALAQEEIRGSIEPRLWVSPPRDSDEAGREAVRFFRKMTGRTVLPWQELAVVEIMAERFVPDDPLPGQSVAEALASGASGRWKWAAANAGLIVARQNGKGDVLLIIELYHLFVLKARRIFHTAQLQRTATDAHKRMADVILNSPKLLAQLRGGQRGIRYGKGDERIIMADGREIIFFTRSDNAGRGLYGDLLVCDEAYDLTEGEQAALRPLVKTAPSPQVIFASTPVDGEVMPNGLVLAGVRKKALAGAERTCWLEWAVPERQKDERTGRWRYARDERLDDVECWAMANPSMGWRIAEGRVLLEMETIGDDLTGMGMRKFLVEDLCAPDWWPDPEQDEADEIPLDPAAVAAFADRPRQVLMDPVVLGVDRSPDGWTSLVAAGYHLDGTWGSETIYHRKGDPGWVVIEVLRITQVFGPAVLVIDAAGPAGALVSKLLAAKLDPIVTGAAEMGRACQALVDDFEGGRYVPSGIDAPFNQAVEIARWRDIGNTGAKAFARKGYGDITSLVATALAGFGLNLAVAFKPERGPGTGLAPASLPPPSGSADWFPGGAVDLASIGL